MTMSPAPKSAGSIFSPTTALGGLISSNESLFTRYMLLPKNSAAFPSPENIIESAIKNIVTSIITEKTTTLTI
jgi:hypothetical protein